MKTIRRQLTRKLLLTFAALLAVGGAAVYLCARTALQGQFDTALLVRAQAIATLTEQAGERLEIEFSDEHMRGYDARGTEFFELWDGAGRVVERSRSMGDVHLPLLRGAPEWPVFWNLTLPDGRSCRAVGFGFEPQNADEKPLPGPPQRAALVVASVRQELDRTLATLGFALAGGGLLLLAATTLLVPLLLGRELEPLQTLTGEVARMDAATLSARFTNKGLPGELTPIATRLNELLDRLEDSFERERRFSSDVAHEFRTPLAELRSMAELAIKLPDARAANMDNEVLEIAMHLESMLTRLLALARAERGALAANAERVALLPLIEGVCGQFREKARDRRLSIECRVPPAAVADTDPLLLRSILTNLVDNAVEYAPPGGSVEVEVETADGRFACRVVNTVKDFDSEDLPRLFERFWRKDAARPAGEHAGLGLSLARHFAEALGCDLTAALAGPSRLVLTLAQTKPAIAR